MEHRPSIVQHPFPGQGEMRTRCRAFDWAATPLGPVDGWPPTLRTTVELVLASGLPNVVLWGRELIQIYNDAYARIIRERHPGALGRGNREVWPEAWHLNGPVFERVFEGETVTLEDALYRLRRSGEPEDVYLTVSFSPIRDEEGAVAGILANMLETTGQVELQRLEAERELLLHALRVERSRLEYIFQQAPTYLAVLRGPGHVVSLANEAFHHLVGRRDLHGRPLAEAIPEAAEQGVVQLLDRVLETGEPVVGREASILLRRADGAPPEERFLDFIYQPLVEADGTRSGVVVHGSDVTEQVRARREVERARDRAARLQALTAALAATTRPEEVAEVVVTQGVVATGAATGLLALRSPDRPDEAAIVRQSGLAGRGVRVDEPFPLSRPGPAPECMRTGSAFFLESHAAILARFPEIAGVWDALGTGALATVPLEAGGATVGAMSFTFDAPHPFSEEDRDFFLALGRQCAQALERSRLFAAVQAARESAERARAEAEAANRSKSQFLATMSHELRTPLNAIGGYAELLAMGIRGPVTEAQARDLERIQHSQQHLLGIIGEVLHYARLETGSVRYDICEVNVAGVLATVEALILPQVRAKALHFERVSCASWLTVRADEDKLRQILLNLVSNAVKFTAPGGRIALACDACDAPSGGSPRVEITVRDTGQGIPADKLEEIFEPFVQVGRSLSSPVEGTGLGLAISRDLARAMGGDVVAESTPGDGSTFTVTLPRAEE